jgi:hypothetical protein
MITKDDLVVAVFDDARHAEQAIADLYQAGFALDKIDMVTRSQGETSGTPNFAAQKEAADGAITGAATGAGVGALAGMATAAAIMMIPGVGIVLGAGLLMGAVGGAALGATGGSLIGPFIALEMSEEDAHYYARAVKDEGRTVVLVQTPNRQADARAILSRHGGRDRRATPTKAAVV